MHVVIVGRDGDRARLRAILPPGVLVVGEASTIAEARQDSHDADALLVSPARPAVDERVTGGEALTGRECQVLELLADGLANKTIASRLGISDQTVKFHVASICGKLGAANRTEAVHRALRQGLLTI